MQQPETAEAERDGLTLSFIPPLPSAPLAGGKPVIPPSVLRRLNRVQAQAELASCLAQQTQAALNQAVSAACEDVGVTIPLGAGLDIDWATGAITITPLEGAA